MAGSESKRKLAASPLEKFRTARVREMALRIRSWRAHSHPIPWLAPGYEDWFPGEIDI